MSATLPVTAISARVALGLPRGNQVAVQSLAANDLTFIKFGDSTVVATVAGGHAILPGQSKIFTLPIGTTHIAAIAATTTATLYLTSGQGQ